MAARTTIQLLDGYNAINNFVSDIVNIDSFHTVSVHWFRTSGSFNGTLDIEVSDNETKRSQADGYNGGAVNNAGLVLALGDQFVSLASVKTYPVANGYTVTTITGGSPAGGIISMDAAGFKWMRVRLTGTGLMTGLSMVVKGKRNKPTSL